MDERKRVFFGAFLIILAFAGMVRPNTETNQMTAAGELSYTRVSVCEWPIGHYLHYYITDHCGRELWFSGDQVPSDNAWAGDCIWAEGEYVVNGSCEILVASKASICTPAPTPVPD